MNENFLTMSEHNEYAKRIDDWQNRQDARLKEAEEKIDEITKLNTNIERLALSMETMQKEQVKQGERLEALEKKDGEMWQTVVKYALTAVIGAICAYILAKLGF